MGIQLQLLNDSGVKLFMLRLDLMHPWAGGNKYFKLTENLKIFHEQKYSGIISFGGAYSNHLTALSWVCEKEKIPLKVWVRGEETLPLNPRIEAMKKMGTEINYLSRSAYKLKDDRAFLKNLKESNPGYLILPEGGKNEAGIRGCEKMAQYIPHNIQHIFIPVGTGGSITGLAAGLNEKQKIWGVPVLKGISAVEEEIRKSVESIFHREVKCEIEILQDSHFGGYAKTPPALLEFQKAWQEEIPDVTFELIYVAKAFAGLCSQIKSGRFKPGDQIVFIHTGGYFPCD